MEWIRWVKARDIMAFIFKTFEIERDKNFKKIKKIIMCNRIKRYLKKHLKRFGSDVHERILNNSQ